MAPFRTLVRWVFRSKTVASGDLARDTLEVRLLRTAAEQDIPTLGICRGAQMMARIAGGTLAQDVGAPLKDRETLWTPFPARDVVVETDSRLHARLGGSAHRVNSLHRHAVDSVPAPMRVVAREARAPIVQAIEHARRSFWIGVQWHPEYMPQDPAQQRLFAGLVAMAVQRHKRNDRVQDHERESARAGEVGPGAHPSGQM